MYAAAGAAAYMCGTGSAKAHAAVEATATLFAQACAHAPAYCEASGDTQFYSGAHANAVATAEAWLDAYVEAFAQASVCGVCDVHASSWIYVLKYLFLEAVASASAIVRHPIYSAHTALPASCPAQKQTAPRHMPFVLGS
jgi:hypothetical protein